MTATITAEIDEDGGITVAAEGPAVEIIVLARRVQLYADEILMSADDEEDAHSAGAPH
jgi:hypothetical protein